MQIKKGTILLADPQMEDPEFFKSVILIVYSDDKEVVGIILNLKQIRFKKPYAANIPGVSQADLTALLIWLKINNSKKFSRPQIFLVSRLNLERYVIFS